MDNKKWSKRFSTIFWWTLTVLPFIFMAVYLIIGVVNIGFTNGSAQLSATEINAYFVTLTETLFIRVSSLFNFVGNASTSNSAVYLSYTAIRDFLSTIGFNSYNYGQYFAVILNWMVIVQFIHVLFDVICWIPRFCHRVLEKGE